MLLKKIIFIILIFIGISKTNSETVELTISNGAILGRTDFTIGQNKLYYAFQGIPYAEPPERFELPIEKKNWSGVLDCTYDKSECVQSTNPVRGSEDCLFVNVYSTNLTANAPVVVFIHGGFFTIGNASYVSVGPDYLLDEDVVFVALQYRLGVFGFMSTGDLAAPGNLGFKDQSMAIKWIYNNIQYFGGNKNKITLFGQSAGAAAVSFHLQSTQTRGYFNGAILNSGTSLCLWSLSRHAKQKAFAIGLRFGIVTTNTTKLVRGLKVQDYKNLQEISVVAPLVWTLENPLAGISFGPVKEPEHPTAFFTKNSDEQLSKGDFVRDVPLMLGVGSQEGNFLGHISPVLRLYFLNYDVLPVKLVPADLTDSNIIRLLVGSKIKLKFFGIIPLAVEGTDLKKFISADQWVRPSVRFATHIKKYQKDVYFYMFSYMGPLSGVIDRITDGVGHSEDLNYIFRTYKDNVSEEDALMRIRIVKLWCNFIKYQNPTPQVDNIFQNKSWTPLDDTKYFKYFNINSTMEMQIDPYDDSQQFYTKLYKDYGKGVYDTY